MASWALAALATLDSMPCAGFLLAAARRLHATAAAPRSRRGRAQEL